ncbi:MAG: hypothetical protein A2Z16_11380 [Chloroflexi bacterium RBG_16_54_18]|nr:MAG: hypothetical protein A2Z16_11380 [Chloroflexi bacterium RBG_16_54_18]
MKIAHIYQESNIRFYSPQAAQVHIYHTMRGLQQAGHEVRLLGLQARRVLFSEDLAVFTTSDLPASYYARQGISGSFLFKGFESGLRRVQSELHLPYLALFDSFRMAESAVIHLKGFDLIHERFNLLSMGGTWASRSLGVPFVLEVNADLLRQRALKGHPEKGFRRWLATWATRISFNAADKIICVSKSLRDHLESSWNIRASKLSVLPIAADVIPGRQMGSDQVIRRRLGLGQEPVVMWVGGFFPWHDLDLLLESFGQVLARRPDARLVLVGDGQARASVEKKIAEEGWQHAVILTGFIAHAQVPEMLSIADVAVVPSAPFSADRGGTGTPLKLFEYMAAGVAIVATDNDQAGEVIENNQTGLLVKAGAVDEFARAILTLLDQPELRVRLGRNGMQKAAEKYSWGHYINQLEEIYSTVKQNAPTKPPVAVIS